MWNKFKSYFQIVIKRLNRPDAEEVDGAVDEERRGDYAVPRSRKIDLLLKTCAFLAACGLWFYVVSTTATSEERGFELVPVVCKNEASLRSEHGLIIQSISIDTLNVTVMGNRQTVRDLTSNDVKAYVNLSEIDKAGEHDLPIYFDLPSGVTVVSQTVSRVLVNVDSPSTRVMELSENELQLRGWSLGDGCFFGKKELNRTTLTLEGPTLALNKVASVELRSDIIGSAQNSFTVTATPYLLDEDGNPISDDSITIKERALIEVHVEVLKSKEVPLVVESLHGEFSSGILTINPSRVTITGDPQAVDAKTSIVLGQVDERTLLNDRVTNYNVKADGLTVTDHNGNAVNSAMVQIKVSLLPTRMIEGVNVWYGDHIAGTVKINVRAVSADHAAQLQALLPENIAVYADPTKPEGDTDGMSVVFSEFFRNAVYEIEITDYKHKDEHQSFPLDTPLVPPIDQPTEADENAPVSAVTE